MRSVVRLGLAAAAVALLAPAAWAAGCGYMSSAMTTANAAGTTTAVEQPGGAKGSANLGALGAGSGNGNMTANVGGKNLSLSAGTATANATTAAEHEANPLLQ